MDTDHIKNWNERPRSSKTTAGPYPSDNVKDSPYTDKPKTHKGDRSDAVQALLDEAMQGCDRMGKFRSGLSMEREMLRARAADLREQAGVLDGYVKDINEFLHNDGLEETAAG